MLIELLKDFYALKHRSTIYFQVRILKSPFSGLYQSVRLVTDEISTYEINVIDAT